MMKPMSGSLDEATRGFEKILESAERQFGDQFEFTKCDLYQHAPYTTVIVHFYDHQGIGFAKCAPSDTFDRTLGVKLATRRALTSFFSNPARVITWGSAA